MDQCTVLVEAGRMAPEEIEVAWREEPGTVSAEASAYIDARWAVYVAEAKAAGRTLFNGAVTWLRAARREGGRVILELSPGEFKAFLVTVQRDRPWFAKHAPEAMRPTLGNSVLLTRGEQAILGIRSHQVSAYARRAHLIGGMLERLGTATFPASIHGILAHLRQEMTEEASLQTSQLQGEPTLLAVVRDEWLGQPDLIWQWELNADLEELGRQMDAHEHSDWLIVDKSGIDAATWQRMTPVARAAWNYWQG